MKRSTNEAIQNKMDEMTYSCLNKCKVNAHIFFIYAIICKNLIDINSMTFSWHLIINLI